MRQILLLHGALGSGQQMNPLAEKLEEDGWITYRYTFSGHGGRSFASAFHTEQFTEELGSWLNQNAPGGIDIFGYSMGGYIALNAARLYPSRVNNVITLGTKFDWHPLQAEEEVKRLNPKVIREKVPAFAYLLKERHGDHWEEVMLRTAGLMLRLGDHNLLRAEALSGIQNPTLVLLGDRDDMVTRRESQEAADALPGGQFQLLPDTPHPFEKVNPTVLAEAIREFLVGVAG